MTPLYETYFEDDLLGIEPDAKDEAGHIVADVEKEEDFLGYDMGAKSVSEMLGMGNANKKKQDLSIDHYLADDDLYQEIYDESHTIQSSVEEGKLALSTYDDLSEDLFLSLFKHSPKLLSEGSMKTENVINNRIMSKLVVQPEFKALRNYTRYDPYNAALGTQALTEATSQIIEALRPIKKPGQEDGLVDLSDKLNLTQEELEELLRRKGILDDLMDQANAGGGGVPKAVADAAGQNEMSLQEAQALANALQQQLEDALQDEAADSLVDQAVNQMAQAAQQASDQIAEETDMIAQWGLDGSGSEQRVSFADKKAALLRIRGSKKLKELTDLIGRLKEVAKQDQKLKVKSGSVAIKSVTTGKRIEDVLPSELSLLAQNATKGLFYQKYNDGTMLNYKKESTKPKGKGPMIVLIDVSGSMSEDRQRWSKAMAIALLEVAQDQKRNYASIIFDSAVRDVIEIYKGKMEPMKVVDIAEKFYGGGTDFEKPLEAALKLINKSEFKEADIVMLTDGESSMSDDFIRKLKETQEDKRFSIMSVLIDIGGRASTASLDSFSNKVVKISNISELDGAESAAAHAIFGSV